MIPLVGALSMAVEASSWFLTQRALQNAADSAVIAAATNGCASGASCDQNYAFYNVEARSVAAKFGFQNGVADTTVAATNNVTCPSGATTCYQVTITKKVPVYLTRIVGFRGDTTTSTGVAAQLVSATAIASAKSSPAAYCMTALGNAADAIRLNGSPFLGGNCSLYAPLGGARCGSNNIEIAHTDVGVSNGSQACKNERIVAPYSETFKDLAPQIPAPNSTLCPGSGSSQYPKDGRNVTLPSSNLLSGAQAFTMASPKCGDVKLTGDTVVTGDSVLVIYNGHLDLQNYKLSTASGAHLTIIFSGTNAGGFDHTLTGTGMLDIAAPQSGTWSGIAMYQDPRVTGGNLDLTYSGSSPTLKVTGLVYAPNANITISGAINHASMGEACLSFMARTILINGTTSIFASPTSACDRAGLVLPTASGSTTRASLVR